MAFSKIEIAIQTNKMILKVECDHALETLKMLRSDELEGFSSKEEMMDEIQKSLENILKLTNS